MRSLIIAIALVLLPLFTIIGVGATDFTVNSTRQSIIGEIIEDDNTFNVVETRLQVAGSNAPATTNDVNNPIDITPADPLVNANNINRGDFVYLIRLKEKNPDSAPLNSKWKVTLLLNDNEVATVYIGNTPADNSSVEGVRIRFNIGSSFSGGVLQTTITRIA
jgi:hypothetical protein